jgi:hypothetical protein
MGSPSSEVNHSSRLKASTEGSIVEQKKNHKAVAMVITLAQGLTLTILQAQSIRSWLRYLDKSFLPRRDKSTRFKLLVYGLYIRNGPASSHTIEPQFTPKLTLYNGATVTQSTSGSQHLNCNANRNTHK